MVVKKPRHRVYFLLISFLVLTISGIFYAQINDAAVSKKKEKANSIATAKVLAAFNSAKTPTATASSVLTPQVSPTSIATVSAPAAPVFSGFCLNVPVLLYHHVMPYQIAKQKGQTSLNVDNGIFDLQMNYLATHGYTTIFAEDLVYALKNHSALPSKSVVVTIDDGYEDNYTYAYPIIKKYNIKTSLMVPTGLLGVTSGANNYYSWSELKDMIGSGLVHAYSHTFSHYAMGSQDTTKDTFEITTAQQQLHDNLGKTNYIFTYPYGTNANSAKEHTLLQANGIIGAFSTIGGAYQCDSFIYAIHRSRVGNIPFPSFGIY